MADEGKNKKLEITDDFFRRAEWVTVEDTYDWDQVQIGPFPSKSAAQEYCDSFNRFHVEATRKRLGDKVLRALPGEKPEWELRFQMGYIAWVGNYDEEKLYRKLKNFIKNPTADPTQCDYRAIAGKYGTKYEYEWRCEQISQVETKQCWCESLRREIVLGGVSQEQIRVFVQKGLEDVKDLFSTSQHYGDVSELKCSLCSATAFKLYIEHEGFGDCWHSYYTFPTENDQLKLKTGNLNAENYESYVESRCGIHTHAWYSSFYKRVKVGYFYFNHKILE
jgi:hypothetical protein